MRVKTPHYFLISTVSQIRTLKFSIKLKTIKEEMRRLLEVVSKRLQALFESIVNHNNWIPELGTETSKQETS